MGTYIPQILPTGDPYRVVWVPKDEYPITLTAMVNVRFFSSVWIVSQFSDGPKYPLEQVADVIEGLEFSMAIPCWVICQPDLALYRASPVADGIPDGWIVVSDGNPRSVAQAIAMAFDLEAAQNGEVVE